MEALICSVLLSFLWAGAVLSIARPYVPDTLGKRAEHLVVVVLLGTTAVALAALCVPTFQVARTARLGVPWAGLTLYLDRLSWGLLATISFVGAMVHRFADRYLQGEDGRARFLGTLGVTVALAQWLVVCGNLGTLAVCWVLLSLSLHRLLVHYPHRHNAVFAARHKFVISRLGDLALLGSIVALLRQFGTLDIATLVELAQRPSLSGADRDAMGLAAWGMVLAAACKSAQVPFHAWLPETLEAPTPVSALMHAGVVNAGGYLLIRFGFLFRETPNAAHALMLLGAGTACFATVVTWAQTHVKRSLAWSTVAQMGFMVLECGLGAYGAAALHIVGHGLYKAHAFLRSGTLPNLAKRPPAAPSELLWGLGLGLMCAMPALTLGYHLAGLSLTSGPHGVVLPAIVVLALSSMGLSRHPPVWLRLGTITALGVAAPVMVSLVETWLGASAAHLPGPHERGLGGLVVAALVVAAMTAMSVLSALLPALSKHPRALAFAVHATHGFYLDGASLRAFQLSMHHAPKEHR